MPLNCPSLRSGQFRGQKSLGPLKISHEMNHKVSFPQKNNIPHFQNQRYINSYLVWVNKKKCKRKTISLCLYVSGGTGFTLYTRQSALLLLLNSIWLKGIFAWDRRSSGSDVIQGFLTRLQAPGGEVIFSLNTWRNWVNLKGQCHEIFCFCFFVNHLPPDLW